MARIAIAHDNVDTLRSLLHGQTGPNEIDEVHYIPLLHLAAREGAAGCIKCLIEEGAFVEKIDDITKDRAIHEATSGEAVRALASAGANMNTRNAEGLTKLHKAIGGEFTDEKLDVVTALVEAGADPNVPDRDGDTPLHYLAWVSGTHDLQIECAELLLDHGADRTTRNKSGHTADACLRSYEKDALAGYIAEYSRVPSSLVAWRHACDARRDAEMVFQAAAEGRPMELARRLRLGKLAGGLEMKGFLPTGHYVSPLAAAVLGAHSECARLLQRAGAGVEPDYHAIRAEYKKETTSGSGSFAAASGSGAHFSSLRRVSLSAEGVEGSVSGADFEHMMHSIRSMNAHVVGLTKAVRTMAARLDQLAAKVDGHAAVGSDGALD